MTTSISGTTGIVTPALDLTTPLPVIEGGTGTSTVKPYRMVLGTPITTTSGTSHDFTSLPTWVKRITVMLNGVSTNGTTHFLVQVGSGSVTTSGYRSNISIITGGASPSTAQNTTGFAAWHANAAEVIDCTFQIHLLSSNVWMSSHSGGNANTTTPYGLAGGGSISLGGTLDRIRLTTVNGTDTFDAGSVNILYEGFED